MKMKIRLLIRAGAVDFETGWALPRMVGGEIDFRWRRFAPV
jgi:hypothetical protein